MKTPTLTLATLLVALSTVANTNTRQAWSGLLQQKSLDQYGDRTSTTLTVNGGLMSRRDTFMHTSYVNEDPKSGMDILPDDVIAYGFVMIWWDGGGEGDRIAYRWERTLAGDFTHTPVAQEDFSMDPVGISWFSGLYVTEDGRNKTIGGFALEVENRATEIVTASVTTDWLANEHMPSHRTTRGGSIPPGAFRAIAVTPEKDEWALADGSPIEEVW